jgi:hypothetical protein
VPTCGPDGIDVRVSDGHAVHTTALLAGLRAVKFARPTSATSAQPMMPPSSTSRVKAEKNVACPIEGELLAVIEAYLESRAVRFPGATKRRTDGGGSALCDGLPRLPEGLAASAIGVRLAGRSVPYFNTYSSQQRSRARDEADHDDDTQPHRIMGPSG